MPELPEVETVVRTLNKIIKNKVIQNFEVFTSKVVKTKQNESEINKLLKNEKIHLVLRKGKYIVFILDNFVLISHLRMEGKFFYWEKQKQHESKHDMYIINFVDKTHLSFNDTRKFGTLHILNKKDFDINNSPYIKAGYEPFDNNLSPKILHEKWKNKSKNIKTTLLEQHILAGIGNIYASEILFLSKIHPTIPAKQLTLKQCTEILKNTIIVLNKAILLGGTTISSFSSSHGVNGKFQNELYVYGRKNEECKVCKKTLINKIKLDGRGTYFCPNCQKQKIV